MYRSPGIYLKADENLGEPQVGKLPMKAQMGSLTSVRSQSKQGKEKKGKKEMGNFFPLGCETIF